MAMLAFCRRSHSAPSNNRSLLIRMDDERLADPAGNVCHLFQGGRFREYPAGGGDDAASPSRRRVADRFDVVAVGIEYEGAVVVRVVLRAQSRAPVVLAAGGD